jgi:hypothetical protein
MPSGTSKKACASILVAGPGFGRLRHDGVGQERDGPTLVGPVCWMSAHFDSRPDRPGECGAKVGHPGHVPRIVADAKPKPASFVADDQIMRRFCGCHWHSSPAVLMSAD